jgi:ABC-type bacteriocin/lantibiotic exporter with double-glycine peptidase domain
LGTVILYWLAAGTGVTTADYMAFSTAFGSVSGSLATLAGTAATFATLRPLLELIEPVMEAVPEAIESQRQIETVRGGIEVSNLSFRYAANTPLVLDNVSLRIRPGEYVAIVGRTGCGKSTLMRLLLGFERQSKGAIYYDGQDITGVDIRSLRRQIGVVMQNGRLLSGDILMNITVACPRATLEDAWEAAEIAGIADDIRRMPMGMQTLLSEGGGGISGGQRQRLLIARAVCGKPKFLMLDEATSALDNVTQRHVSEALENLKCTRVVIAHRLSTIRHADRIIMLEDGKIVESGSYDELVAAQGAFADLVARQQLGGE